MTFNKTDRVLVLYDGTTQDGLLAAATVKKSWKESHAEDDRVFLESEDKIASKFASITFKLCKEETVQDLANISRFDRVVIIGVPVSTEVMKILYKTFKKRLLWIECKYEHFDKISGIGSDSSLVNIDGLRGDMYSLCELTWIYYETESYTLIPLVYKYIGQFHALEHDTLIDKNKVVDFVFSCNKKMKTYNDWYKILEKTQEEQEMFINEMIKEN